MEELMMNIEQFKYVVEIAKTNSVSIASQNLHISQSAISQAITKLEDELEIKIFTRSRIGTFPTDEGKQVIQKSYEILLKVAELEEETKKRRAQLTGDLKISIIPNMMLLVFNALSAFKNEHPYVNIEIIEKGSREVLEDVKYNKIDFGLVTMNVNLLQTIDHFAFEELVKGKIKIFAGKNHPLALKSIITIKDLMTYPLVLFKSEYVKSVVNQLSKGYGPLNILFTTDSNDVVKKAIMDGLGIGIGTSHVTNFDPHIINGDIIILDIEHYTPQEEIQFGWIQNKGQLLSPAAKIFIDHLKSQIFSKKL